MPQRTHAGYSGAWILFAAVVLIAGIAAGFLLLRDDEDAPGEPLEVTWAVVDGQPICAYDDPSRLVTCHLSITGNASQDEVMVTVTAWADENMAEPVGSATQPVPVEGDEDRTIEFTVPVRKAPYVDADREAFCSIEVEY